VHSSGDTQIQHHHKTTDDEASNRSVVTARLVKVPLSSGKSLSRHQFHNKAAITSTDPTQLNWSVQWPQPIGRCGHWPGQL